MSNALFETIKQLLTGTLHRFLSDLGFNGVEQAYMNRRISRTLCDLIKQGEHSKEHTEQLLVIAKIFNAWPRGTFRSDIIARWIPDLVRLLRYILVSGESSTATGLEIVSILVELFCFMSSDHYRLPGLDLFPILLRVLNLPLECDRAADALKLTLIVGKLDISRLTEEESTLLKDLILDSFPHPECIDYCASVMIKLISSDLVDSDFIVDHPSILKLVHQHFDRIEMDSLLRALISTEDLVIAHALHKEGILALLVESIEAQSWRDILKHGVLKLFIRMFPSYIPHLLDMGLVEKLILRLSEYGDLVTLNDLLLIIILHSTNADVLHRVIFTPRFLNVFSTMQEYIHADTERIEAWKVLLTHGRRLADVMALSRTDHPDVDGSNPIFDFVYAHYRAEVEEDDSSPARSYLKRVFATTGLCVI